MTRTRFHSLASRLHRWLAAIIGIQLMFWFASGTYMSFMPIEKVRGEHLVDRTLAPALPKGVSAAAAFARLPANSTSAELVMVDGRAVVLARRGKADMARLDATTGQPLPPLDAEATKRIVSSAWKGSSTPSLSARLLTEKPDDFAGDLPVWRVSAPDVDGLRAYVSPVSGKILAVRTDTWRLYDFLWGLHIMDWKGRENFNTPWLSAFAGGALVLALAGFVLLIMRWPPRRRSLERVGRR